MDREQLDGWCEKGILGLVLAILVYSPLAFGAVAQPDFDYFLVVEWLTVAILAVWIARFWINPAHRLLWPPVCWAVLAFASYAVARYFTAEVEFLARREMIKVLVYAVLFFATVNNLHRQVSTQILGLTVIFVALSLSLFAIYQFVTGYDFVWNIHKPEGYRKRGSGTFICPNNLAGYLEMTLPLALSFMLTGRFDHVLRILLGYSTLVIVAGITATVSRAGWLATGISLAVLFAWLIRQRDFRKHALAVLAVLAVVFTGFFIKADLPPERHERFDVARQVEDVRFQLWPSAVAMWRDHPWFGVGPDHFDARFPLYRPAAPALQLRPDRVHNDYLNTLVDWGVVGAVLVLLCWVAFYYQIFRGWKFIQRSQNDLTIKHSNKSAFVAGGALGLLAILVHSVFDFNLHIPANAILAVTLMALVAAHYRFASERYWHTVRWPLRLPVTATLLAVFVYLTLQTSKQTLQNYWIARSAQPGQSNEPRLAALRKAWNADTLDFRTAFRIGEALRLQSWRGEDGYQALASEAITWFKRSMDLNSYNPEAPIRRGMCLHWLGKHQEAGVFFQKAEELDPNGYNTEAYLGWHYFQLEDYATARKRFEHSLQLLGDLKLNPIPHSYLNLIAEKLKETGAAK